MAFNKLISENNKVFGPDWKPAMGAFSNLGKVDERVGKYKEAEASLRRRVLVE
jgi:hypothetical protein